MESGLVLVHSESEHVAQVGFNFHGSDQRYAVEAGEAAEFMSIPRPAVFGDAEAAKAKPVGFQYQVFWG
jgi:hypothetical protein